MDKTTPQLDLLEQVCFRAQADLPALFKNRSALAEAIVQHSAVYRNKGSLVSLMSQCFRITPSGARQVPLPLERDILAALERRLIALRRPELVSDFQTRYRAAVQDIIDQRDAALKKKKATSETNFSDRAQWKRVTFIFRSVSDLLRGDALHSILRNIIDAYVHHEFVPMMIRTTTEEQMDRFSEMVIMFLDERFKQSPEFALTPERLQRLYADVQACKAIQLDVIRHPFELANAPLVVAERLSGEVVEVPLHKRREYSTFGMELPPVDIKALHVDTNIRAQDIPAARIAVLLNSHQRGKHAGVARSAHAKG